MMKKPSAAPLAVGGLALLAAGAVWRLLARLPSDFFDTSDFMPHGHCYLWNPWLVRLHVGSDMAIGLAYVSISATLAYLVYQARKFVPFGWMFLLFGTFIIACGGTHFMEVWTLWKPDYWTAGHLKLLTALVSVGTALALPGLIPKAVALGEEARLSHDRKERLEKAHRELKRLDELKSQFFANISHELRTPLTLILGPARRALAESSTEDERRRLATVERNAVILLKHVNDILDIAKLEAGKMPPQYAAVDLSKLVRAAAANFESYAAERGMELVVDAPEPVIAEADKDKVERILLNLISNAFKFTPDRGRVRCAVVAAGGSAVITVEDNGPGVPPELREAIFERFRQLDSGAARRFGGTGLGLAIAKEFAELHGGSISVLDAEGGGARFVAALPLKAPAGAPVASQASPSAPQATEPARQALERLKAVPFSLPAPLAGKKRPLVLIVEDNPEMSRYIAECLAAEYDVAAARNGREGMEQAAALRPALIMTDLMMPDMDGADMIAALRAEPGSASTPIIVVTAKGEDELRLKLLRSGAQDYLLKPFSAEELVLRARNLIQLNARTAELARANEELETFTYSASHDLMAPLRKLDSFGQILEKNYSDKLDEEGRAHLARIRAAAKGMSHLIDSMLELSRIGRHELNSVPLDLSDMAKSILEDLRKTGPTRTVRATIAAGLTARGDKELIRSVLTNLLANAWKFTSTRAVVEIELGAGSAGGETAYFIRDNGVGFDMAYAGKLFQAFTRLHRPGEFPGSGIGLATVRRIIERHGGRVWVDAAEGRGATFFFTLP